MSTDSSTAVRTTHYRPSFQQSLKDAVRAFQRGLQSAFSIKGILYSIGIWLVTFGFWTMVTASSWGWLRDWFAHFTPSYPWLQEMIYYLIVALLFVSLVFITIMVFTNFFLIQIIRKQIRPDYPTAQALNDGTSMWSWQYIKNTLQPFLGFALIPLVFWIPVVGAVIMFVLLGYLNVRSFTNDALDGVYAPTRIKQLAKHNQYTIALLGCMLAGFAFIPFVHIILPWLLGSSVCHMAFALVEKEHALESSASTANTVDTLSHTADAVPNANDETTTAHEA